MLMNDTTRITPPRTMMEVFENLSEGTMAQFINNQIYISPAPASTHQIVLGKIFNQLFSFVENNKLGQSLVAPVDVFLNRKNIYQPDIIFIANEHLSQLKERGFYGAPNLVIEILSPATWRFDKEDKKDEYERSGVKEYWMIDPADKSAEGFYLEGSEFVPAPLQEKEMTLKLIPLVIHF
jgi:Uma2 family endonuclease